MTKINPAGELDEYSGGVGWGEGRGPTQLITAAVAVSSIVFLRFANLLNLDPSPAPKYCKNSKL